MTGSTWRGQAVLRISVSNWSTSEGDVRRSLEALGRALTTVGGTAPAHGTRKADA
jgi:hypothetical protein